MAWPVVFGSPLIVPLTSAVPARPTTAWRSTCRCLRRPRRFDRPGPETKAAPRTRLRTPLSPESRRRGTPAGPASIGAVFAAPRGYPVRRKTRSRASRQTTSCRSCGRVSQSDMVRVTSETLDSRFAQNLPPETNFLTHERPGGDSFGDSSCRLEVLRFLRSSMSSGHSRSLIVKVQSRSAGASSALSSRCCSCMRTSWSRQLA